MRLPASLVISSAAPSRTTTILDLRESGNLYDYKNLNLNRSGCRWAARVNMETDCPGVTTMTMCSMSPGAAPVSVTCPHEGERGPAGL